jgi:hypothetical protein
MESLVLGEDVETSAWMQICRHYPTGQEVDTFCLDSLRKRKTLLRYIYCVPR